MSELEIEGDPIDPIDEKLAQRPEDVEPPRRESFFGVLGTAAVLGVTLLALGAALLSTGATEGGQVDGAERVAELFRDGAVPFGLELAEAKQFPTRETILRFARPEGGEPSAPETGDPDEIVLIEYPSAGAARRTFETGSAQPTFGPPEGGGERDTGREASARMVAWEKDPSFAWHTTLRRDQVAWGRWRADYRIERSFREGGTWRDSLRIDLCQPGRSLLLYAQFPVGVEATEDQADRVARTVAMRETE